MADPNFRSELNKAEVEPLRPIEKKLIGWSLGTEVAALVILTIVSRIFPPH